MRLHGACFLGASSALSCIVIVTQPSRITVYSALVRESAVNHAGGLA
jgi:hypothetical protein